MIQKATTGDWLRQNLPRLVLSPSFAMTLFFVYGFIIYTAYISMTKSRMLPKLDTFVGLDNYTRLWKTLNWQTALDNLLVFGTLYMLLCGLLGLFLAILLDQKIRAEGFLRTTYLYPMALSFIVTGTAWKWFLNPGLGLEKAMQIRGWGWKKPCTTGAGPALNLTG